MTSQQTGYPQYDNSKGIKLPRTIIEWCCGPNSRLRDPKNKDPEANVIRITEFDDARTSEAYNKAKNAINGPNTLLWISIPCTGGSQWQNLAHKTSSDIRKDWKLLNGDILHLLETSLPADIDVEEITINRFTGKFVNVGKGKGIDVITDVVF